MIVTTNKHKEKKGKVIVTRSLITVLILSVILLILVLSACNMYDLTYKPGVVEPSLTPAPAKEPSSVSEQTTESIPELVPEPTPEIEITEAKSSDAAVFIDGEQTPLLVYEIDELAYIDLFEVAQILSDTEREFFPAWDEENEALHLTSEGAFSTDEFSTGELSFLHAAANAPTAIPVDVSVFLDGSEVTISAFNIAGGIFFDLFETAEALDLIIDRDVPENTINIFTSRALASRITRKNSIDPSLPMVALTFDDGPGDLTVEILDILEQHGAVATFYVLGRQVEKHSETVVRAFDMGCEIGNHSWSHPSLERVSSDTIHTQLQDTSDIIESVIGVAPLGMRPPYARINSNVRNVSRELGLSVIFWSIDPSDYLNRSPEKIYDLIMEDVQDRDIILLHDIHERSVAATRRLVPSLIRRGFQLVTVSELMYYSGITLEPGESYNHGRG